MLLERERELAEIDAVIGEVGSGKGCAVVVEAGAGLGKTRLLQEARAAAAQAGLEVLTARATELEQDFPFALVRQLFELRLAALSEPEREQVLEGTEAARGALGLDSGDGATSDSFAVLHGLYWVTAALAERRPLLLAIDDAHWADAVSLDYLGFLLPRLEELPVLLIVTCRPEEPEPSGNLQRILADPAVRRLSPAPLSTEGTSALLAEELERQPEPFFAATCHEVSGGNPFLLSELSRTLLQREIAPVAAEADQVRELAPEQVARTVLTRLERLVPAARAAARALAVLGDDSDPRLVAELAEADPESVPSAADELRAASIFDQGASLRFIHPLVRNGIYAEIPASERAQTHARAAALLHERGASPERIATQLLASEGSGNRVGVETLLKAGERALANGAPRSAIAYLMRALREPPPPELRAAVLEPLIPAVTRAADLTTFAEIEGDLFAEMERQPSLRSRWAIDLTVPMIFQGRFEEIGLLLKDAAEVAMGEGDVRRAFQLEAQLRTIGMLAPSLPEVDLGRYAGQIDPDSAVGRLAAAFEAASALVNGTAEECAEAAKHALGNGGAIFYEEPEFMAATTSMVMLAFAGELDAARDAVDQGLGLAQERNATPEMSRALFCSGFVAWAAGDFVRAEADFRQAVDLARLAGIAPLALNYSGYLIEVLIERDELDEAEALLQAAGMASGPIPQNAMFAIFQLERLRLRLERGDMNGAAEDYVAFAAMANAVGAGDAFVGIVCLFGTRALLAIGERERACEMIEDAVAFSRRWGTPAIAAATTCAIAVTRGGAEAVDLLEQAATMSEGAMGRFVRLHALLELGAALRREGHRAEARTPLREALEEARRCGMVRVARRAREELQATGETVRRYAPIGVESLTPSERRVAELAASGMTNRQIAQSLFVTLKTVEAHLSAAYDKLDISSRKELPMALDSAKG